MTSLLTELQVVLPERCEPTRAMLAELPDRFIHLGTLAGIEQLENQIEYPVPECLALFYRFPALACWLAVHHDTDILLSNPQLPPKPIVSQWYYRPHLIIAGFPHSQIELGVQLDCDNPRVEWGCHGAQTPLDYSPTFFADWIGFLAKKQLEDCMDYNACFDCRPNSHPDDG